MCDERERLIGYVYEECDPAERRAIDDHLEACGVCREEIRGLRNVRGDLLAWDVPEHESVWRPFAPARVTPFWREVPAWAMAVAATLVFAVGAAGGEAARAFLSHDAVQAAAPTQVAAAGAPAVPVNVNLSAADQAALEAHLLARVSGDLDARLQQVSLKVAAAPARNAPEVARELAELRKLIAASREDQRMLFTSFNNDMIKRNQQQDQTIDALRRQVVNLSQLAFGAMPSSSK